MFKDELKVEKISARINELELMNNNIKLLNDMLLNYNPNITSDSEKETIKVPTLTQIMTIMGFLLLF